MRRSWVRCGMPLALALLAVGCKEEPMSDQPNGFAGTGAAGVGVSGAGAGVAGMAGAGMGAGTGAAGTTVTAGSGTAGMAGSMAPMFVPGSATYGAVFEEIIMGTGCNAGPLCHGGAVGGLRMMEREATYLALVSVPAMGTSMDGPGCVETGMLRVAPGNPDQSLLLRKVEPVNGMVPCGTAMPPAGMLTPAQVMQIRGWIMNGAMND